MRIEPPPSLAWATGRTSGGMCEIPGVSGRTEQAGLGGRQQSEFRTGAFSEHRDPAVEKTLGKGAGVIGDVFLEDAGAEGRSRGLEKIEVLQQERHAGEGAVAKPTIDLPPGVIVMLHDHRV